MQVSVCQGFAGMPAGNSALPVLHACPGFAIARQLAGVDGLASPPVALGAEIVKVRNQREAIFPKENIAVGVEQVGLVVVDQVFDALEVMHLPRVRRLAVIDLLAVWIIFRQLMIEVGVCGVGTDRKS